MNIIPRFIVVDDDKFNNALCTMVIGKIWKDAEVITFHDPVAGLEYVVNEYPGMKNEEPTILLLDINMPLMDGWEFLDQLNIVLFQKVGIVPGRLHIYVLSSSVDKKDVEKVQLYKSVSDYLVKPITKATISRISMF
jgi:CheY-like chemotaxis protein